MFTKQNIFVIFFLLFSILLTNHCSISCPNNGTEEKENIKLTILYDNYIFTEGTKSDWGFACLIEGNEKTKLFDTGIKSDILWYNIEKLNIDLNKVE